MRNDTDIRQRSSIEFKTTIRCSTIKTVKLIRKIPYTLETLSLSYASVIYFSFKISFS